MRNTAASLLLNTAWVAELAGPRGGPPLAGPGARRYVKGLAKGGTGEVGRGWCRSYCGRACVVRDFGVEASNELFPAAQSVAQIPHQLCAEPVRACFGGGMCLRPAQGLHRGSRRAAAAWCLTCTLGQVLRRAVGVFAVAPTGAKPRLSGRMAPALCACPLQTCVW